MEDRRVNTLKYNTLINRINGREADIILQGFLKVNLENSNMQPT